MTKHTIRPIRIEGSVAYVPLTQGYEAIIDAADLPAVEGWNWCALVKKRADGVIRTVYAIRNSKNSNNHRYKIWLHRVIIVANDGEDVDHVDGDGLNCRRANLRAATRSQNMHNQRTRCDNTSGAKGVMRHRGKWTARISAYGKKKSLGYFETVDEAAAAYAKASQEIHAEFSRTQ